MSGFTKVFEDSAQDGITDRMPKLHKGATYIVDVHVAVAVEVSWDDNPESFDDWVTALRENAMEKLTSGYSEVQDADILWQTLEASVELCMHRNGRKGGRQDLFCTKPDGHVGNHYHETHPGGAYWNATSKCWVYGRNSDS